MKYLYQIILIHKDFFFILYKLVQIINIMPKEIKIKTKEEIAEIERKKKLQAAKKRAIVSAQKKEIAAALEPKVTTKQTANDWEAKTNIKNEQEIRAFFNSIKPHLLHGTYITD